jgi:lipoate-protein ligase A
MTQTLQKWRLLPFLEASGSVQMAIDRWLFQQHQQGNQPPSLRFYTWSPVALTLGYHQRQFPSFWQNLHWNGCPIDIIQRPTGGRAVLHQGDLTYMVVTSGLKGNRKQVYEEICQFLIEGWRSLGIKLHYGSAGRGYIHNPNCFATATEADLLDEEGNKRIGSAQLRQGDVILQHGSMILNPDSELFKGVFGDFAPVPLNLYPQPSLEKIMEALIIAAQDCFKMELELQSFSESEWQLLKLMQQNYT